MAKRPRRLSRYIRRQLELRERLWPGVTDDQLWIRTSRDGFTTIPRAMTLILDIMDDMAGGHPVSMTYLELWCRIYDEGFVVLSKPREMAFHSGFSGQRAERTWTSRMRLLGDLGFIDIRPGPSGALSYALILNPYHVIKRHHDERKVGVREDKFNALVARTIEIGAKDLDAAAEEPKANSLDDEIPF